MAAGEKWAKRLEHGKTRLKSCEDFFIVVRSQPQEKVAKKSGRSGQQVFSSASLAGNIR